MIFSAALYFVLRLGATFGLAEVDSAVCPAFQSEVATHAFTPAPPRAELDAFARELGFSRREGGFVSPEFPGFTYAVTPVRNILCVSVLNSK